MAFENISKSMSLIKCPNFDIDIIYRFTINSIRFLRIKKTDNTKQISFSDFFFSKWFYFQNNGWYSLLQPLSWKSNQIVKCTFFNELSCHCVTCNIEKAIKNVENTSHFFQMETIEEHFNRIIRTEGRIESLSFKI